MGGIKKGGNMKKIFFLLVFLIIGSSLCFAGSGYLYVTSTPSGAVLKVDGKLKGKTPVMLKLPSGKHKIEATFKSYTSQILTADVVENEVKKLHFDLKKTPGIPARSPLFSYHSGKGDLTVITDISDADVFIDGYKIKEKTPVTVKGLSSGFHSVIIVKDNFAIYKKVLVREGKTIVINGNFKSMEKAYSEKIKKELEEKRKNLPARITVKLEKQQEKKESEDLVIWGESDIVEVVFRYRKEGAEKWNEKNISWTKKEGETFTVEKGNYEIEIIATHYKEDTGLITIFKKAEKKKVGEGKIILKKDFLPDTQYTFNIFYDGKAGISYRIEEKALNTPVE